MLFCPSELAVKNLEREGITKGVYFVGDVMYDLYLEMEPRFKYEVYEELKLKEGEYIVVTMHRDFNVDDKEKLEEILKQLRKIAKEKQVVFPIHPRTRKRVEEFGLQNYLKDITVIEPVDYLNLMGLVKRCWKVITDSGGLQKEAYFAGKQAVVLMPDTGWRELVEIGWNRLANEENLYQSVMKDNYRDFSSGIYGKGNAAELIVEILCKTLDR